MGQNDVLGTPERLPSDADNFGQDSNADNFKVFVQISVPDMVSVNENKQNIFLVLTERR